MVILSEIQLIHTFNEQIIVIITNKSIIQRGDTLYFLIPTIRKICKIVNDSFLKMEKHMSAQLLFELITNLFNKSTYWLNDIIYLITIMEPQTILYQGVERKLFKRNQIKSWHNTHNQLIIFREKYKKYFIQIITKIFVQLPYEIEYIIGSYLF